LQVLTEKELQNQLSLTLKHDGYNVIQQCTDDPTTFTDITKCKTHEIFGIDIVAQKKDKLRIIEVKGQPKGGVASCSTFFMAGIGQILTRVTSVSENIYYSLAIPNTDCFAPSVRKFMENPILSLINLSIILILPDGSIEFVD